MIGETILHYRVLSPIGSGGTGALFRAEDLRSHRQVALRLLPAELAGRPERLERFQRGARAVAALNHPHIVTLLSVEQAAGRRFITMELVKGRPLNQVIPAGGLGIDEFLDVALVLAELLAAVHEHGIAHCAFTSSEVLVPDAGAIKVMGFGSAGPGQESVDLAAAVRADLAAWGLIGCEMLLGRKMQTEAATRILNQLALREDIDFISRWRPEVPLEISRLISQCVQPVSTDSPQTAREVGRTLRDFQARLHKGELTCLPLSPEAAQSRKTIVNWTLVFVLLNLLLALFALFYWKR